MNWTRHTRRNLLEPLEPRYLMTSVPFGASSQDTAEFMLGDVTVNVVLLESNGAIDANTEQWNQNLTNEVQETIAEGLQWWVDLLGEHSDVHTLNFQLDTTYLDDPVEISYEPISRGSQDFTLWIEEFFRAVDLPPSSGFSTEIREFNHRQRVANGSNWAFTIFVVNAEQDANDQFGDANGNGTAFRRAFAYAGGQFIVMPHSRPASTVAHEVGHMFWAHDEYAGGESYGARRGYYGTQNTNALTGHPHPSSREPSIMASRGGPFTNHEISVAAREMIGWRDSDGDGIFDVLDVPHTLAGTISFDQAAQTARFVGSSSVDTLTNLNTEGTGHEMTLNRITGLQYRVDDGVWQDLAAYDDYQVSIDVTTPQLAEGVQLLEFRTIDHRWGVTSEVVQRDLEAPTQNPENAFDVNGDGFVSPIDVLRVIIALNVGGAPPRDGSLHLDVSGDAFLTALDALIVINYINDNLDNLAQAQAASAPQRKAEVSPEAVVVSEAHHSSSVAAIFASDFWQDEEERDDPNGLASTNP